jgi:hypothetical protein
MLSQALPNIAKRMSPKSRRPGWMMRWRMKMRIEMMRPKRAKVKRTRRTRRTRGRKSQRKPREKLRELQRLKKAMTLKTRQKIPSIRRIRARSLGCLSLQRPGCKKK